MKVPTDLEILECIYRNYYHDFAAYEKASNIRSSKIYVPIDADFIGRDLNVDGDIIWGRLYYHMNSKYSYSRGDGTLVEFFILSIGTGSNQDNNAIQFPLMASVLADMQAERRRFNIGTYLAVGSLIISLGALVISMVSANTN